MFIAQPSFSLLYILDEVISPTMTIKAVGFFLGGPKLYIFKKIKDTNIIGQKNNKYYPIFLGFLGTRCFAILASRSTVAQTSCGYAGAGRALSITNNINIDPSYITGFVDGEGSFKISIYKKNDCKTG